MDAAAMSRVLRPIDNDRRPVKAIPTPFALPDGGCRSCTRGPRIPLVWELDVLSGNAVRCHATPTGRLHFSWVWAPQRIDWLVFKADETYIRAEARGWLAQHGAKWWRQIQQRRRRRTS
jgi:hypothetical protein